MSQEIEEPSRGLLRSMFIIGSAKSINILILMLRMKAVALLLGPAGVGVLALYSNFKEVVTQIASMGIATSGVREVAMAKDNPDKLTVTRRVLVYSQLFFGLLACLVVWLFSSEFSVWLFGDKSRSCEIALLGFSVLLGLVSASQISVFQGLRLISDLGRIMVFGGLFAMLAGVISVWFLGEFGLVLLLIFQPIATILIVLLYSNRLPPLRSVSLGVSNFLATLTPMLRVGVAFMLGALLSALALLVTRALITDQLGIDTVGHFSAAWAITVMYVGFLLSAMSADYYPRLAEVIDDTKRSRTLMNDQLQLALVLAGPLLLLAIGWAEWILVLLYSDEFVSAVKILQWQMMANIFKLASWPLSYSLVASGRAKTFFLTELLFNTTFIALIFLLLPHFGLSSIGFAFLISQIFYFSLCSALARNLQHFKWDTLSVKLVATYILLGAFQLYSAGVFPLVAKIISPLLAIVTSIVGLRIVLAKVGGHGRVVDYLVSIYSRIGWPIKQFN